MSLVDHWRRHPVVAAVVVGLVLRLVAALSGFGWFAADDYFYVIEPAWRWLDDPSLAYPSPIRSPFYPRIFFVFLWLGDVLADDPRWVLRFAYLGLGLLSLAVIPGVYALARRLGSEAAATAALLAAAHALMPRLATRALIEVGAMLPLVWSLVLLDASARGRPRRRFGLGLAAGCLFVLAAMVRFQIGVVGLAMVGWMVARVVRREPGESLATAAAGLAGLIAAAPIGVGAQAAVDVLAGRAPFGTLWAYVEMNIEHSSGFGESAWYTYLLHLVMLTIPPVTLWLARPLWGACRRLPVVGLSVAVFVVAHSLVPHKEDRFMFPILPLILVLIGAGLAELARGNRWQRRAVWYFWGINCVALPVACLSDAQRNMTEPLLAIAEAGGPYDVAVVGAKRIPRYYVGRDQRVRGFRRRDDFLNAVAEEQLEPDFILLRPVPSEETLAAIEAAGLRCTGPREFRGDLVDRALLVLNRRHNKRRRATGLLDCR